MIKHCLTTILLVALGAISAQAQWSIVFQDRSKSDLNGVYFLDQNRGWIIGNRGIMHATQNGGGEWAPQNARVTTNLNDIFFRNRNEGWLIDDAATILRTMNAGETWDFVFQIDTPPGVSKDDAPKLYSLSFPTAKKGWIVGTHGRILHTDDGGRSWTTQESGTKAELVHVKFVNDRRGWAVGEQGLILFTDNGRGDRAWIVGDDGFILRTTNAGVAWENVSVTIKKSLVNVAFMNDRNGWVIGHEGTILRTGDGGLTWVEQESGTEKDLYGISIKKGQLWVVGADGLVLRYSGALQ
jgi:photosystem II stability/assembly factor-like uncharacterized protein